jgi:hypothetical protein
MPELAACTYNAAAWRLERLRRDLNYPDVASLAEAEFLAPPLRLVTDEDLAINATRSAASSSLSVTSTSCSSCASRSQGTSRTRRSYVMKREESRAVCRRRREFAEQELENPNSTSDFDSNNPMWNWTETTSDDDE